MLDAQCSMLDDSRPMRHPKTSFFPPGLRKHLGHPVFGVDLPEWQSETFTQLAMKLLTGAFALAGLHSAGLNNDTVFGQCTMKAQLDEVKQPESGTDQYYWI
jgi:hypothetical protein